MKTEMSSHLTTKVRKVTKKASTMKVPSPVKKSPKKEVMQKIANPTHMITSPNGLTPPTVSTLFNPHEKPIEFSEFDAKYNLVSQDNLVLDRVSFGESLRAYEEQVPLVI
jgi:hypothetical protein